MHRCLQTPDVLYHILDFVLLLLPDHNDSIYYPYHGYEHHYLTNPALAALARTCRTFLEPALDLLWRHQMTLGPLLLTFPSNAVVREEIPRKAPDNTAYMVVS